MKTHSNHRLLRSRRRGRAGGRERGAALVIAILVLAILTVIGIALMLITSTESRIAANEWSVNRAFYAADAGIRWASVEAGNNPIAYFARPELTAGPFGSVLFQMPSHRNSGAGFFAGDPTGTDIQVRVQTPSLVGRHNCQSCPVQEGPTKLLMYEFEVRTTGGENDAFLQYSKGLVADVSVGPFPWPLPF